MKQTLFISLLLSFLLFNSVSFSEEIELVKEGGIYKLPVLMNEAVTLKFVLDTGASEAYIPEDVIRTLWRAETIDKSDFLEPAESILADGSVQENLRVNIRSLKIGSRELNNISATIGSLKGELLLGQNALEQLEPWRMDSKRKVFIMGNTVNYKNEIEQPKTSNLTTNTGDNINSIINDYLNYHNNRNANKLLNLYNSNVEYYDKGIINKTQIKNDKQRYFYTWDKIDYKLSSDPKIKYSNDNIYNANFIVKYYEYDSLRKREISGTAMILLDLIYNYDGYKIVSENSIHLERNIKLDKTEPDNPH